MCSHRNSHLPSVWICLPSLQSFCQNTIHELIKCLVHGWGIPYGMVSVQRIHITVNTMAVDSCPCDSGTPAHVTLVLLCSASPRSRWPNRMMQWPSFFLNILFWHKLNGKHFRGPLRCCIWSDSCELLCMAWFINLYMVIFLSRFMNSRIKGWNWECLLFLCNFSLAYLFKFAIIQCNSPKSIDLL